MNLMTVRELREKYLRFFGSKGHTIHDSGSLIPIDVTGRLDESLLFNGAGMIQFKPYFLGTATPPNKRLVTAQKCVRTGDIDEVGDDSHLTFFEMLGNFSFGDYFKKEAIAYSWEFLTGKEWLGLDPTRLSFTVFEDDDLAYDCWSEHISAAGIDPTTRIMRLSEETNYWPPFSVSKGSPGPCGPNSEMFYWTNPMTIPGIMAGEYSREQWIADDEAKNWLEIWNDVFIQFDWQGKLRNPERPSDGWQKSGMPNLPFLSIDTGMGMERTVAVLDGKSSVYDTDAFLPILAKIDALRSGDSANQPPPVRRLTDSPVWESDSSPPTKSLEQVQNSVTTVTEGADSQTPETQMARRVIADHIRTSCFCIADGVMPANNGRGYVLRRLIRRAVLKGQRVLGFNDLFMHDVAEAVFDTFGDHYKELIARRSIIEETLKSEETLFRKTLDRGVEILKEELVTKLLVASGVTGFGPLESVPDWFKNLVKEVGSINPSSLNFGAEASERIEIEIAAHSDDKGFFDGHRRLINRIRESYGVASSLLRDDDYDPRSPLSGSVAFQLYDTFGFPLEITQELCAEAGIEVDLNGYEVAMKAAQELSRGAQGEKSAYGGMSSEEELATPDAPKETEFLGYQSVHGSGTVVRIRPTTPGKYRVALDQTPFYGESGGQTGDTGEIRVNGNLLVVENTTKSAGTFWHDVIGTDVENLLGKAVEANVDAKRRARIKRNHTATHLLQAALRQVLGTTVTQAGSYVGPDNLRFDFTHGKAMSGTEIAEVEQIVNEQALANTTVVTYVDLPIDEARAKGAMALFGEKYGNFVRMVEIGEFSKELCGGIHVRTTGEIGLFKIVSESSAASGVRRIEAITGEAAYELFKHETEMIKQAASLLKANPKELVSAVERTVDQLKDEKKKREKAEMAAMSGGSVASASTTISVKGVDFYVKNLGDADP
jgi:alanyl-tRNA synthetase